MKKILLIASSLFCAVQIFAQGTIAFQNTSSQLISNNVTSASVPTGSGFVVGLYYGVAGTVDENSLTLIATTGIAPVPGRFTGPTVTTPATTAPGSVCVVQIRAWSGNFANYDLAYAAALADGTTVVGKSLLFNVTTGNPNPPATTPGTLSGLTPFRVAPQVVVPEPSSIALGLLGLGAIALFRRRK